MKAGEALAFVAAVVADPDRTGCREWPAGRNRYGYGVVRVDRRATYATHVALEADGRPRPSPAHEAMHACDNPPCVAPWHLSWGTHAQNLADATEKGRRPTGEDHHEARLTVEQVAWIRTCGLTVAVMARRLGVGAMTVSDARRGHTWAWLTVPPPFTPAR